MKAPDAIAVDFETEPIQDRPEYPPKPVGVAVQVPGEKPRYWAWGHPSGNNCTAADGRRIVQSLWKDPWPKVFHHGKFDQDVAETHLGVRPLGHEEWHDTMYLAFLADPHSFDLGLKAQCAEKLGVRPEARDELKEWVLDNVPGARGNKGNWGAYISRAPGDVVARYAAGSARKPGDVVMTARLFAKLHREVVSERSMGKAYDRERRLQPIMLESERRGVCVDVAALRRDVPRYEGVLASCEGLLRKRLGAPSLDFDKKDELAAALDRAGVMESWTLTKTGKLSTAKKNILAGLGDRRVLCLMLYRGALATMLRTFMRPWLATAERTGGRIHTHWNQVRNANSDGRQESGARTGRLSSSPNFQNIPTEGSPNYERVAELLRETRLGLPPLPLCRSYIVSGRGRVLLNRDYSQQELRILGHYEDGVLLKAYRDVPWLDQHEFARDLVNGLLGTNFSRKPIKNMGFGLIYGMGLALLAEMMGTSVDEAKLLKKAYLDVFPGVKSLMEDLKELAAEDKPLRTWGGREYYVEKPRIVGGRLRSFEYKLLNVLIQGSAADCTKEATIAYHGHPGRDADFLLTVHDEFLAECDAGNRAGQMRVLMESMESVEFDLPMLSEGAWGRRWSALKDVDKVREHTNIGKE